MRRINGRLASLKCCRQVAAHFGAARVIGGQAAAATPSRPSSAWNSRSPGPQAARGRLPWQPAHSSSLHRAAARPTGVGPLAALGGRLGRGRGRLDGRERGAPPVVRGGAAAVVACAAARLGAGAVSAAQVEAAALGADGQVLLDARGAGVQRGGGLALPEELVAAEAGEAGGAAVACGRRGGVGGWAGGGCRWVLGAVARRTWAQQRWSGPGPAAERAAAALRPWRCCGDGSDTLQQQQAAAAAQQRRGQRGGGAALSAPAYSASVHFILAV
jgi:hypothetical protein